MSQDEGPFQFMQAMAVVQIGLLVAIVGELGVLVTIVAKQAKRIDDD